jgi:hypothetical protein
VGSTLVVPQVNFIQNMGYTKFRQQLAGKWHRLWGHHRAIRRAIQGNGRLPIHQGLTKRNANLSVGISMSK